MEDIMNRKNVLFIIADQLRTDTLGCYGNDLIQTPHIDALAEDGTRYERCYTANPLCMPSRCSVFSGMYPRNHGLWSNGVLAEEDGFSLASRLSASGYQTANIGKMHFQPTMDPDGSKSTEARFHWNQNPCHKIKPGYWGFDYIKATIGHSLVTGNYKEWFLAHGGNDEMFRVNYTGPHTGGMDMPVALHCSSYIGETGIDYIKNVRKKEQPFFLTVSFPDPHFPFTPPDELVTDRAVQTPAGSPNDLCEREVRYSKHYTESWDRDGLKEPAAPDGCPKKLAKERIARTYEMTELMDQNIGKIIEALKDEGIYEDTVIFFFSDHGELLGDHGLWFKGPFLYEGLINVPLIVVDHREKNRKSSSSQLVSLIDLFPTVCELTGIEIPFHVDGISFVENRNHREHCLVEYRNGYGEQDFTVYALVSQDDKLIRFDYGFYELSDFRTDPKELHNFASHSEYERLLQKRKEDMLELLMKTSTNRFPQICAN